MIYFRPRRFGLSSQDSDLFLKLGNLEECCMHLVKYRNMDLPRFAHSYLGQEGGMCGAGGELRSAGRELRSARILKKGNMRNVQVLCSD